MNSSEISPNAQHVSLDRASQRTPVVELNRSWLSGKQRLFMQDRVLDVKTDSSLKEKNTAVVLLEGDHESGIRTILEGFGDQNPSEIVSDDTDRQIWRGIIVSKIVTTMREFLQKIQHHREQSGLGPQGEEMRHALQNILKAHEDYVGYRITRDVARSIRLLQRDNSVREFFGQELDD